MTKEARTLADAQPARAEKGIALPAIEWSQSDNDEGHTVMQFTYVTMNLNHSERTAEMTIEAPKNAPNQRTKPLPKVRNGGYSRPIAKWTQAILHLRMNFRDNALVLLRAKGL